MNRFFAHTTICFCFLFSAVFYTSGITPEKQSDIKLILNMEILIVMNYLDTLKTIVK